ncbi:MAG: hypothetical protein AYK18_13735 [Theionarchaea archaeon DG-70]|nr:MAG: hypothetical protein AYK18_13735 [Theionarchaea archaeon DG-70]
MSTVKQGCTQDWSEVVVRYTKDIFDPAQRIFCKSKHGHPSILEYKRPKSLYAFCMLNHIEVRECVDFEKYGKEYPSRYVRCLESTLQCTFRLGIAAVAAAAALHLALVMHPYVPSLGISVVSVKHCVRFCLS